MSKNCRLPDYTEYHFQPKEGLLYMLEGILIVAAVGCFFYHSWIACLCLAPVLFLFLKEKKRELAKKYFPSFPESAHFSLHNVPFLCWYSHLLQ